MTAPRLLLIGGTRFLGRHLAGQALGQGWHVTLLHRGLSGAGLFPQAEHRLADRDGDLAVLAGRDTWDLCIDTSAYVPRQVRALADVLRGRVGQFQLVSSVSAYANFEPNRPDGLIDETTALAVLDDPTTETIDGTTYGGLKAACEAAAVDGFGAERVLAVRPGLIVGPHDPTGRFTWWVQRLLRGGEVLAPGDPAAPVQAIDARDLAAWQLGDGARAARGAIHLSGPVAPTTLGNTLPAMAAALTRSTAAPVTFTWTDEDWLLAQGVAPWMELPLWLPRASQGLHRLALDRAAATGLVCRPLAETAVDVAAALAAGMPLLAATPGGPPRAAVGLAPAREAALLEAWHRTGRPRAETPPR